MPRSLKKGPFVDSHLEKKIASAKASNDRRLVKTWSRRSVILPDFISATKAEKIGLINKAVDESLLKKETMEAAQKISKKSAITLKIGKKAFYKQIDMTLSDAYDYASNVMVENMLKLDAEEGIGAFIEKRKPNWQDK